MLYLKSTSVTLAIRTTERERDTRKGREDGKEEEKYMRKKEEGTEKNIKKTKYMRRKSRKGCKRENKESTYEVGEGEGYEKEGRGNKKKQKRNQV